MKRRFLWRCLSMVLVSMVGGVAWASSQKPPAFEQSFQILPGGTVEIDNPSGRVQVETWNEHYVHVKAEKISPAGQPVFFSELSIAASESTIVVGCRPSSADVRIDLTVYAPRNCNVRIGKSHVQEARSAPAASSDGAWRDTDHRDATQANRPHATPTSGAGTSSRIVGSRERGADDARSGVGPIKVDGDTKTMSEGSMGVGVRVIPPLGAEAGRSSPGRPRSSDRDPFAIFDEDPFFNPDRETRQKPRRDEDDVFDEPKKQSSRTRPDAGLPGRQSSTNRRSEPVLRSRNEASQAEAQDMSRGATRAGTQSGTSAISADEDVLVLDSELVNLNLIVRDRSGKPVAGLTQSSFQVFEDDVLQQIAFFSPHSAPINLALVLDLSGSMREKAEVLKAAAIRFIDILSPQDRVAVVAFTHQAKLISPLTHDRAMLRERIQQMSIDRGRTALYEAVYQVINEVFQGTEGQRNAMVVLSDGVDNSISEFNLVPTVVSFEELLTRLEESDITTFPIYLDTEQEVVYKYLNESPEAYRIARERLRMMAEITGGMMFYAARLEDLDQTYQQVASELRAIYTLGYYPSNTRRDGSWRRIKVKTKDKNLSVRTRAGYYAR
ncbi:MAG: VWA domain-containing protein [Acidobacteriota bacterium]|nr:VWA domain-containing protein [Blastocatellia bacterium]MDW8239433.1 VWA domain-containing protein [Acidobacteriota bacterium]